MISVYELNDLKDRGGAPGKSEVVAIERLDQDEEVRLSYIDAKVESLARNLVGEVFDILVDPGSISLKIVSVLKQAWEAGGWVVGVFRAQNSDKVQIVFAKSRNLPMRPVAESATPMRERSDGLVTATRVSKHAPKMTAPLLIRMPTRGRPEQAMRVLSAYREFATDHVAIEVVIDEGDETTNDTRVLQRLCDLDCSFSIARHANKIDAVNGGRRDDFAIVALASDDMMPVSQGYDRRIVEAMHEHFPLLDGAVYFNDGYNRDHVRPGDPVLCTMPILGRHLYDAFGYIYHPEYGSLYSDNEQTQILTAMRRIAFVDECIIEHRHHAAGKAPYDMLYQANDNTYGAADKALFERRAELRRPQAQFAFDAPPLWLSLLICSTTARQDSLRRLEEHLRAQMRQFPREVEICVSVDDGQQTIGAKRQALLERAVGLYVAFVDDDDFVVNDYVKRVLDALKSNPAADCASLVGTMTTNGERPERFEHSLKHTDWYTRADGVHVRSPNHLSAIRREHALKAGFPSKNFGEDHSYSKAVQPLLKTEVSTGDSPAYFYWWRPNK